LVTVETWPSLIVSSLAFDIGFSDATSMAAQIISRRQMLIMDCVVPGGGLGAELTGHIPAWPFESARAGAIQAVLCPPEVRLCPREIRIELQRLLASVDRAGVIAELYESAAHVVVGDGEVGVDLEGLAAPERGEYTSPAD